MAVVFACALLLAYRVFGEYPTPAHLTRFGVFTYLFFSNEPILLALSLVVCCCCYVWALKDSHAQHRPVREADGFSEKTILWIAVAVFSITFLGTFTVYHRYPLSTDEYMVGWQAEVFRGGQVRAALAPSYWPFAKALAPYFALYSCETHTWISQYLPVYAQMHAIFMAVGAAELLNPLLSAGSILLIGAVAKQLWPGRSYAPVLAALLLATSGQVLITGMSFYAMPAHLFLSLLWLLLYLRADNLSFVLLPWVGLTAIGLHQPHMHALFVLPFLLRIARTGPWARTLYIGVVYLGGCIFWFFWMKMCRSGYGGVETFFTLPSTREILKQFLAMVELVSWENLAVGILALVTWLHSSRLSQPMRDLAWGLALTYSFNFFITLDQGHGWGCRYCHAVLGNLVLLAVAGAQRVQEVYGTSRLKGLIVATVVFALGVQLPIRAWQVERFVRPFAQARAHIEQLSAEIVLVDPASAWFAVDLVRNGPYLESRPLVMRTDMLNDSEIGELYQHFSVHRMSSGELEALGLIHCPSPNDDSPIEQALKQNAVTKLEKAFPSNGGSR
jgi:hypothetical protein